MNKNRFAKQSKRALWFTRCAKPAGPEPGCFQDINTSSSHHCGLVEAGIFHSQTAFKVSTAEPDVNTRVGRWSISSQKTFNMVTDQVQSLPRQMTKNRIRIGGENEDLKQKLGPGEVGAQWGTGCVQCGRVKQNQVASLSHCLVPSCGVQWQV